MTGLDKILSKILSDAQSRSEQIIEAAKQEAKTRASGDIGELSRMSQKRIDQARADAEANAAKTRSAAALKTKRLLLEERNRMIDDAVSEVRERIRVLPEKDYFSFLEGFILSHAQSERGVIVLNQRDLSRLPEGFEDSMSRRLPAPVTVSEIPGTFDAGCILIYGDVEFNGTLEALISENRDQLRDLLNQKLFEE